MRVVFRLEFGDVHAPGVVNHLGLLIVAGVVVVAHPDHFPDPKTCVTQRIVLLLLVFVTVRVIDESAAFLPRSLKLSPVHHWNYLFLAARCR